MNDTTAELRGLLYEYDERLERIQKEYLEAKENNDQSGVNACLALRRQCKVMIAQLWHVMVKVRALDEEEIEFGNIKRKE